MTPWIAATLTIATVIAQPEPELFVHIRTAGPEPLTATMPYDWMDDLLEPALVRQVEKLKLDEHAAAMADAEPGTRVELTRGRGARQIVVSLEQRPGVALAWLEVARVLR